ncbi:hypothetical protein FGO68_gene8964 [Halteria grandinella]|uniref:Uncharacterized protein n=1 Tax=Halteria grandinella TaxID=5974 RepID=A0A8J8NK02_HALGN|nr:hypothetical protein FGO68_gene8964 [Halteria grandinella]
MNKKATNLKIIVEKGSSQMSILAQESESEKDIKRTNKMQRRILQDILYDFESNSEQEQEQIKKQPIQLGAVEKQNYVHPLRCFTCKMHFDVQLRIPINTPCCQDICCILCWQKSVHNSPFKCPLDSSCKLKNPQDQPAPVKHLLRNIQQELPATLITCKSHPLEYINKMNTSTLEFTCDKCNTLDQAQRQQKACIQIDRAQINKAATKLKQEIDVLILKIMNTHKSLDKILTEQQLAAAETTDVIAKAEKLTNMKAFDELIKK